jgi:Sigma-70, region 4
MTSARTIACGSTDAELLSRSDEDSAAFAEIYSRHVVVIHRWFAAMDQCCPGYLASPGTLADAARSDRIESRARARLGLPVDLALEDGYAEVEQRLSPRLLLVERIDQLASHEREALELRIIDELPYEEVAERLSIAPAAARLRVSRALRRLARAIPREEP